MDVVAEILAKSLKDAEKYRSIDVKKHLDLELDVGSLLAFDTNDLDSQKLAHTPDDYLLNLTRDNVQLLLNEVWTLPTERVEEAIVVKLPPSIFRLPRAKRLPKPRPLTKWEKFAKEKGIQKKKKSKLSWDEQLHKWVPLYGFQRAKADREKNWVMEVPQNADPFEDQFAKKTEAKVERVAKNELQRLRNIAKAKNVKVPRVGITNPDVVSSKELSAAVTIARSSTASIGKFQDKLPKEKEARGISEITPGASRKRKAPPVPATVEKSENLAIIDSVLNKRPKIEVHDRPVNLERPQEEPRKKQNNKGKGNKKPKSGKGQKKGKGGGRKRR